VTPKQQAALDIFAPAAVAAERESAGWLGVGYPAELVIVQWGAETNWSLEKVTGIQNYFGLTAATCPDRARKLVPTHEEMTLAQFSALPLDERESVTERKDLGHGRYRFGLCRWFACFDNLADGISAYIKTITHPAHRYYPAWQQYVKDRNVDNLINGIAKAGYATSGSYAALLQQLAHQTNVQRALQIARDAKPDLGPPVAA